MAYLGGSGSGSLMRLYVARCCVGLQSSGALTGVAGLLLKMTCLRGFAEDLDSLLAVCRHGRGGCSSYEPLLKSLYNSSGP